ncbi:MAG: DUF4093 domain-containing protein [Clostridia bacterium]|nr:DUF4093 domain-containing protein [Clostridia bacterium]
MEKLKISRAIIVEGKYDKIKLENIIDGLIITTEGFGIFRNAEKKAYIRKLAEERGLLIITDSDSAGFMIRNHLRGFVREEYIANAYIPQIKGKEKRKSSPSKEGTLGVEGVESKLIIEALRKSGALDMGEKKPRDIIYKSADLFNLGLTGGENSKAKKEKFVKLLGLPTHISTNALIKYMNTADETEIKTALEKINE